MVITGGGALSDETGHNELNDDRKVVASAAGGPSSLPFCCLARILCFNRSFASED